MLSARRPPEVIERLHGHPAAGGDWRRETVAGGLPPAALARTGRERSAWFEGYVRTYLERDLRDISQVSSLPDFRRLMGLSVHRVGRILNQAELGRDAGIAQATAHRHLNLLGTTFQIHKLAAFVTKASRRLIKAPKLFWSDTGLAAHLAGITDLRALRSSPLSGSLVENLVLCGLRSWSGTLRPEPRLAYWRTAGGAEVDFVVEHRSRVLPVEVKSRRTVRPEDLRHLDSLLDEYGSRALFGIILYDTAEPAIVTRRIVGLPLKLFV